MKHRINILDPEGIGLLPLIGKELTKRGIEHKVVFSTIVVYESTMSDLVSMMRYCIANRQINGCLIGAMCKMNDRPTWKYRKGGKLKGWVSIMLIENEISLKVK